MIPIRNYKNIHKLLKVMHRKLWSLFPDTMFTYASWHWCRDYFKKKRLHCSNFSKVNYIILPVAF